MQIRLRILKTTGAVIDALYGDTPSPNKAFARLISYGQIKRADQHVSNYRSTGVFPPDTILIVRAELEKIGCTAPASMFRVAEPKADKLKRAG